MVYLLGIIDLTNSRLQLYLLFVNRLCFLFFCYFGICSWSWRCCIFLVLISYHWWVFIFLLDFVLMVDIDMILCCHCFSSSCVDIWVVEMFRQRLRWGGGVADGLSVTLVFLLCFLLYSRICATALALNIGFLVLDNLVFSILLLLINFVVTVEFNCTYCCWSGVIYRYHWCN